MEIFMSIIGNEFIKVVGGALAGVFFGGVAMWVYVQSGLSKIISNTEHGKMAGNKLGLLVYHNGVSKIQDTNLRNKVMDDLDTAGNDFDLGWSKGVRGEVI